MPRAPPAPSRAAPASSSAIVTHGPRSIPDDDLVGKTLNGTYVVDGVIGEGGMGKVYRARHTRIASKEFAVKVLRAEFTRNPDVVTRFRREAEAAASITHANVVGVYDVDSTPEGHSYLVCEYLRRDLADELPRGPLDIPARAIAGRCARSSRHARGVGHRDLKPPSVLDGEGKSGVSRRGRRSGARLRTLALVDASGTQMSRRRDHGTPAMAPEQSAARAPTAYGRGRSVPFCSPRMRRPPFSGETCRPSCSR